MQICVNDEFHEVSDQINIALFLSEVGFPCSSGIAVAVNSRVVKKNEWEKFYLTENDKVLIIKATQGG